MKVTQKLHDLWIDSGFVFIIVSNVEKKWEVEKTTRKGESRSLGL